MKEAGAVDAVSTVNENPSPSKDPSKSFESEDELFQLALEAAGKGKELLIYLMDKRYHACQDPAYPKALDEFFIIIEKAIVLQIMTNAMVAGKDATDLTAFKNLATAYINETETFEGLLKPSQIIDKYLPTYLNLLSILNYATQADLLQHYKSKVAQAFAGISEQLTETNFIHKAASFNEFYSTQLPKTLQQIQPLLDEINRLQEKYDAVKWWKGIKKLTRTDLPAKCIPLKLRLRLDNHFDKVLADIQNAQIRPIDLFLILVLKSDSPESPKIAKFLLACRIHPERDVDAVAQISTNWARNSLKEMASRVITQSSSSNEENWDGGFFKEMVASTTTLTTTEHGSQSVTSQQGQSVLQTVDADGTVRTRIVKWQAIIDESITNPTSSAPKPIEYDKERTLLLLDVLAEHLEDRQNFPVLLKEATDQIPATKKPSLASKMKSRMTRLSAEQTLSEQRQQDVRTIRRICNQGILLQAAGTPQPQIDQNVNAELLKHLSTIHLGFWNTLFRGMVVSGSSLLTALHETYLSEEAKLICLGTEGSKHNFAIVPNTDAPVPAKPAALSAPKQMQYLMAPSTLSGERP